MSEPTDVSGAGTAAGSVGQMQEGLSDAKIRSTLSGFEQQLAEMMARAEESFASQQQQLDAQRQQLAGQIAAVRQQAGPPEALLLSQSLAQRVTSIAAANPDIHPLHFTGITQQADRLHEAVTGAADGNTPVEEAEHLAHAVITWFERSHPRATSKFLEGAHEAVSEAERIIALLPELGQVVKAVASAV